jgi:hypothetical protein
MCGGSHFHLVGASISFEKIFYWLSFTPPSLVRRIGPSVCFSEAMYDIYRRMVGESVSIDTKSIDTELKKWRIQLKR